MITCNISELMFLQEHEAEREYSHSFLAVILRDFVQTIHNETKFKD